MPDTVTLTRIAERLGVSLDYLVGRTTHPLVVLDRDVRDLVDGLELSDAELLRRFTLMVDGMKLTPEEARRFIAFIRAERSLDLE